MLRLAPVLLAFALAACGQAKPTEPSNLQTRPSQNSAPRPGELGTGPAFSPNYAHNCSVDGQCSDVPGTRCDYGMCTADCSHGEICPSGTVCSGTSCYRICTNTPCAAGSICDSSGSGGAGASKLCRPPNPSVIPAIGRDCATNSDCDTGQTCYTNKKVSWCSHPCETHTDCGDGNVCLEYSNGPTACANSCPNPGGQSTCRSGFICTALTGLSQGACL